MKRLFSSHPLIVSTENGKIRPFVFLAIIQMLAILVFSELVGFVFANFLSLFSAHLSTVTLNALKDLYIPFGSVILSVYLWLRFMEKRDFSSLGFFTSRSAVAFTSPLKNYLGGLILALITMKLFLLMGLLFGFYTMDRSTFILPSPAQSLSIIIIFFGWLVQGAAEEILVRGFLFQACTKKSILTAALTSSAVFSMLHLGNDHLTALALINLFLYGLLALCLALFTESLWASAAYHGAWNFSQGNLFGIAVSGNATLGVSIFHFHAANVPAWLSGGTFGAEGSILVTGLLLISILILLKGIAKRYDFRVLRLN